jgi:hypothetical protein
MGEQSFEVFDTIRSHCFFSPLRLFSGETARPAESSWYFTSRKSTPPNCAAESLRGYAFPGYSAGGVLPAAMAHAAFASATGLGRSEALSLV